jgi:hypothetical protein
VLFAFEGAHNSLHGHGHGHHTFLDQGYQNIRELTAGNDMLSDKHEFIVVNEASALIQICHPIQMNLEPYLPMKVKLGLWTLNSKVCMPEE